MIIDRIIGKLGDYENSGLRVDRVMLDHYDMAKPHQKLRSQDGTVIGLSLEHGEHLFCGAVIYADDEKLIAVDLIPEDVRAIAHDVLRHRIGLSYEAEANNVSSEEIISQILNKVEVP